MMLFATVYTASKDTEKADIIRSPFLLFFIPCPCRTRRSDRCKIKKPLAREQEAFIN